MPWFKVDDNLAFHAKAVAAGNSALGLWVRAGSWCAQQLTDGRVPDHMLASLGTKAQANRLVAVGLWGRENSGFRFHEWADRQPSKQEIEAERAAARDRMRRARAAKKGVTRAKDAQVSDPGHARSSGEQPPNFGRSSPEVRVTPTQPIPVPSQSLVTSTPQKTAQTLVADWIDHCSAKPPSKIIGQVAKEVSALLAEGIAYERVLAGVAEWNAKGLHPSTLASVVHGVGNRRAGSSRQRETDDLFESAMQRAHEKDAAL